MVKRLRILLSSNQIQGARQLVNQYLDGAMQQTSWEFGTDLSEMDVSDTLELMLRQAGYQTIGSLLSINTREARVLCSGRREVWRELREAVKQANLSIRR
jgi:hypothetical protein